MARVMLYVVLRCAADHVKRCLQMGRPLDVCLHEGSEVAEIDRLYRKVGAPQHSELRLPLSHLAIFC